MTDQTEDTNPLDAEIKEVSGDAMKTAMEKCGCDCASMMAQFSQCHPDEGTTGGEEGKKGCC